MCYDPESLKSEGILAVEITENDRQQSQVVKCFSLNSWYQLNVGLLRCANTLTLIVWISYSRSLHHLHELHISAC